MKYLFYRIYCLIIISLALFSIPSQAQDEWTHITDLPTPRVGASACIFDGKIYVIGGIDSSRNDVKVNEVYDPLENRWETKAPMPTARGFLLTCVVNDTIYAIGGGYQTPTNKVEAYDPVTNNWTTKTPMIYPWTGVYGGVVNDTIYAVGGNYTHRNCFAYDLNTWEEKTLIPIGQCGGPLSATVYNGLIYTFGGTTLYPNFPLSTVDAYNPQTDTWDTSFTHMHTPRYALRTFLVKGIIYAIAGSQGQGTSLATVEGYDPATNTWYTLSDMPFPLSWFTGAVFNDSLIYIFEGTSDWVTGTGAVWEYTPPSIPVELTSFTASANRNEVTLNWSTASETNNRGFEVQRKLGNAEFKKISFVAGYGTTTQPHSYSIIDINVSYGNYTYRLKQIDFNGSYEYSKEVNVELREHTEFELSQNYPNPFNPSTILSYVISHPCSVTLKVYDVLGNELAALVNEEKTPGTYEEKWNAVNLSSGVYFYQLKAGDFISTKKMILLK